MDMTCRHIDRRKRVGEVATFSLFVGVAGAKREGSFSWSGHVP